MRRAVTLLLAPLVAVTGCAGPRTSIDVSVRAFPGTVLLGMAPAGPQPSASAASSAPPVFLPPPAPPVSVDPPPVRPTDGPAAPSTAPPVIDATACPKANGLIPPEKAATQNQSGAPFAKSYAARVSGTYDFRGPTVQDGESKGSFPAFASRTIDSVTPVGSEGAFTYVSELRVIDLGFAIRTTFFQDASGIYVKGIELDYPTGFADTTSSPVDTALPVLKYPIDTGAAADGVANASSNSAGPAPVEPTAVRLSTVVTGKGRVDACGEVLDAWQVDITDASLSGPNRQLLLEGQWLFGTQYGGVPLSETLHLSCQPQVSGCYFGSSIDLNITGIINQEPLPPSSQGAAP